MTGEFFTLRHQDAKGGINLKHRTIFGHAIGDALNAMLDHVVAEIDKETKSLIHQPQVGQNLFAVDRIECSNRFHFHDYRIIDEQVGPEAFVEPDPIPYDRNSYLSFDRVAVVGQFMCKQDFIYDFEDARPETSVQAVGSINDDSRDFILFHRSKLALLLPACEAKNLKPFSFSRLSGFAPLRENFATQGRKQDFTLRRQDAKRKER